MREKITLIRALLLPKLTHLLVFIPNPSTEFMKRLEVAPCHFITGGRADRLQRLNVCKPHLERGLEMIKADVYVDALNAIWIGAIIQSSHGWTLLLQEKPSEGRCFLEMNGNSLVKFSEQAKNQFWAEVLRAFSNVSNGVRRHGA